MIIFNGGKVRRAKSCAMVLWNQTTHVHDQWEPKVFKNTSPKVITAKRVKSDNIEWWKSDKGEELCNGEK